MLLHNGSVAASLPLTLLGHHWNFFQKDEQLLAMDNSEGFTKLGSIPDGYYAPQAIMMPRTAGRMRGDPRTEFGMTDTGTMYGGITTTGDSTFGMAFADADGQLISTVPAGGAPATIGIDTNNPLLTASLSGDGTATFGMTTNTPLLGALGGMTVTATFGMDGTLASHAIGIMEGTTAEAGVTVDNVVNGVWNAATADYQNAGSTGLALSTASSGGVDPSILAAAVWTYVSRTMTAGAAPSTADIVAALEAAVVAVNVKQVNDVTVTGTGATGDEWGP